MEQKSISDNQYLAVRREFVFKVDGNRPILYPLDYINTNIHFLTPLEGFVLSLLSGDKPFFQIKQTFQLFFPNVQPLSLQNMILNLDRLVRQYPSQTGIGKNGLIEFSDSPIIEAHKYDPREFVINPADFQATMTNLKTMGRLETPINIYTVFTHHCVTRCLYCYAERKKVSEMPLSRWREIIQEMADIGIQLSSPDNGDTFARKDGIDLLECLLEHNMHFLLSTKSYVSKENVKRLINAGFTKKIHGVIQRKVQLSIDAVDNQIAKRILNIPKPRTEQTLETFENFLSFGIMPKIKAVITGLNYNQPKYIVERFYSRGARVFHFVRYHRSFHRHTDDLFVNEECFPTLNDQFAEIQDKYPDIELVENLTSGVNGVEQFTPEQKRELWENRLGCGGGWYALGVDADGKAFLCEQMVMDEPYIVGDARTQSIEEIWNSERMLRFIHPTREQFKNTSCYTCKDFEECMWKQGRCYRDAYFSYGSIYQTPPMCPKNTRPGLRLS
jgi:radical SAM protein with 4Fe4S-binding SPASM domain